MAGQLIARLLGLPAYRDKTTALVLTAQQTIYRAIIVLLTITAILWMAVFLYVAFYYSWMPAISHTRPVHLQFESCGRDPGLCTYPTANVTLTRRQQLLMVGQPYKILVELDMPESKRNQEVGMFMVCLELKDAEKIVMDQSCRAAMLHYKSPLLQTMMTTMFAPVFISGSAEEKQMVVVELFSGFEEDPMRPVTEAMVQVRSQHVEVYKVALRIHAHFTGLRYFMFHWPVLSAFLGIMTNLFFLSVIAFLSWYKFFTPKEVVLHVGYDSNAAKSLEERRAMAKERLLRERSKLVHQKSNEQKEDLSEAKMEEIETAAKISPSDQVGKEQLETPNEEDSKKSLKSKEESGKESPKTSDEYEVIPPELNPELDENETTNDDIDEDDDFSELDPDTNGKSSKEEEEDKENIPSSTSQEMKIDSEERELRQRKPKSQSSVESDEGQSSC